MWNFSDNQSWALNQTSPNLHLIKDCSAFQTGFINPLWKLYPSMRHFPRAALVLDKDLDLPTLEAYLASQTVDMFFCLHEGLVRDEGNELFGMIFLFLCLTRELFYFVEGSNILVFNWSKKCISKTTSC